MRITLTVTAGPHAGKVFSFHGHDTFLVGRSKRAHFRLPQKDKYFSRVHFLIEVNPPRCRIMDMGSRNGTHVNGQKIEMTDLNDGDQIRAGHTVLCVQFEPTAPEQPALPAVPTVPAAPPPTPRPHSAVLPSIAPVPLCQACDAPVATPSAVLCP